jgi:hypothetical protein
MINSTDILSAWQRIGWSEAAAGTYTTILDTDNKTTLSGLYTNGLHGLCTFKNVKDSVADMAISSVNVNLLLKQWQQDSITEVLRDVFPHQIKEQGKICDQRDIDLDDKLTAGTLFVGYEITVPEGFVMTVKYADIFFDKVATFSLYFFNINKQAALTTKSVTSIANASMLTAIDVSLYGKTLVLSQGKYIVGYFQSAISSANAIRMPEYGNRYPICKIESISATPNEVTLPIDIVYTGETYGLNLIYTIEKDHTLEYLFRPEIFDYAIGYSICKKCLEQILFSERYNKTMAASEQELNASARAFIELKGKGNTLDGMVQKYDKEIEKIKNLVNPKKSIIVTMK